MQPLSLQSPDGAAQHTAQIAELFPHCVTETAEGRKIDFDLLRQELSRALVEGPKERYRLEWPGKREAIVTANLPTTATLRPVREDSVNFDTTENLYLEGDNLEVLKLLQESYLGQVKMIYIDPPYNTGKDFVYRDNFSRSASEELFESGQTSEDGERLVQNPETSGRYHSDWLSMMYPRLKLARNLLTEDGVIFISIDDNEVHNLRKVCDEIFGENCVEEYVWDVREDGTLPKTSKKTVRKEHEYIIAAYKRHDSKSLSKYISFKYKDKDEWGNPDNDYRGPWMSANISRGSGEGGGGSKSFIIKNPAGIEFNRDWAITKDEYKILLDDDRIYFADNGNGVPRKKIFQKEPVSSIQSSIFEDLKSSQSASKLLASFLGFSDFNYPKPIELLNRMITISTTSDSIILDFFSGSATTAHAVLQLNAEDGGKRKFILVQLPEQTDEKSEAYKAGYSTICEIGKERIRRAARKIQTETKAEIDYGFRVFRLDSSNMQDVYHRPQDYDQTKLDLFADNVKPNRTAEDLLAQVLLSWGLPLSLPVERKVISGKDVFAVAGNSLYACFDSGIDETFAQALVAEAPLRIVFRDSSFSSDTAKENVRQILAQLGGEFKTEVRVI
jgi:adenine-specific DNA-methyltransferase